MEFGKLYFIDEEIEVPEFYHIHTYHEEEEAWYCGKSISTSNFPIRKPDNLSKNMREQEFESIRKEYFVDYPSRFTCLFAIEFDQTSHWETCLRSRTPRNDLVKIKLKNGKLILLDDCFFDSKIIDLLPNLAINYWYWKGDRYYEHERLPVYLFEGDFTVIDILSRKIRKIKD